MVSTPEQCDDNIPMTPNQYESMKNPSAQKSLRQFSETLDVKHKTGVGRLGKARANLKAIITSNVLWSNISKRSGHAKMNRNVRKALYNWIIHHTQVVQYTTANYCIYLSTDGK